MTTAITVAKENDDGVFGKSKILRQTQATGEQLRAEIASVATEFYKLGLAQMKAFVALAEDEIRIEGTKKNGWWSTDSGWSAYGPVLFVVDNKGEGATRLFRCETI